MWASKTLLCAYIKLTCENDDYDISPRREEVRGESLRGDRGFVESGETLVMEKTSP